MQHAVTDWIMYLERIGALLGVPLAVAGVCFLTGGWRFGRAAVICAYSLCGLFGGLLIGINAGSGRVYAVAGALLLPAVGLVILSFGAAVLTGALSALTVWITLGPSTLPPAMIYILMGLTFVSVVAIGAVDERMVTVILTAFLGGVFVVSALIACGTHLPEVAAQMHVMAKTTRMFYPFLLTVASVCGMLVQFAAIRKRDCGDMTI